MTHSISIKDDFKVSRIIIILGTGEGHIKYLQEP